LIIITPPGGPLNVSLVEEHPTIVSIIPISPAHLIPRMGSDFI
jgi:hypothetical protein